MSQQQTHFLNNARIRRAVAGAEAAERLQTVAELKGSAGGVL